MTRKKIGYVELHWTCPNCGNNVPGTEETCLTCGSPQPEDVQFHQAERQELITDEEKIARAKAGADIHCAYCGTRNPADATSCSQCKADLSEGAQREAGRVVGAFKTGPVEQIQCPHCGAENPDTALTCSQCSGSLKIHEEPEPEIKAKAKAAKAKPKRGSMIVIGAFAVIICIAVAVFAFLSLRTTELTGTVEDVRWERSIPIEAFIPVEKSDWWDEIPNEGQIISCDEDVRSIEDSPAANSVEVCGTPYTMDTGSGVGEVVQDCEYHVYDDYCTYSIEEWSVIEFATTSGNDLFPSWPDPVLTMDERLGETRTETYACIFEADGELYTYEVDDLAEFQDCQIGSSWKLNVNTFGAVLSIEK
jgi:ribosomal protein L40E